jgi:NitT/TauT family transport system substrate-binding protein
LSKQPSGVYSVLAEPWGTNPDKRLAPIADEGVAMRSTSALVSRAPSLLLAVALVVGLAACGGNDKGSSGGSGPETTTLTVGVLPVVDAAPVYLAVKQGYFKAEGLDVKFQSFQGGAAIVPAMVAGTVQVSFSNWVSVFLAKSRGIDLTVVADGDRAKPGFSGVFTLPGSPIKSPADLSGKKVAVNTLANIGDVAISAVLKDKGVDPKSIKYVEIPFPDMGATLQRGQVDAIWVVEPFTSAVKGTLKARSIIDPFSGPTDQLPVGGYAMMRQFADKNPRTVAAFQRALAKAVADVNSDSSKVAEVLPTYTKITADAAGKLTLPEYVADLDASKLQRVADLMQDEGKVSQKVDVASFTKAAG